MSRKLTRVERMNLIVDMMAEQMVNEVMQECKTYGECREKLKEYITYSKSHFMTEKACVIFEEALKLLEKKISTIPLDKEDDNERLNQTISSV